MFPNAFIVTADDDVYYQRSWLKELLDDWSEDAPTIRCHRAHRLPNLQNGQLAPYRTWEKDVQDEQSRSPSKDLLPTGLAGVLYYPRSLHPDVTNASVFLSLCPTADDLWFFWQARRANSLYAKVGSRFPRRTGPDTKANGYMTSTSPQMTIRSSFCSRNTALRRCHIIRHRHSNSPAKAGYYPTSYFAYCVPKMRFCLFLHAKT